MPYLMQILIVLIIFAIAILVVIENTEELRKIVDLLPDFSTFRRVSHSGGVVQSTYVKVIVFVPDAHAEQVRVAIAGAGGGHLGHYKFCSFSTQGIARYRPEEGAHPSIGTVGKLELVEEERIEVTILRADLQKVVNAIQSVHPNEEAEINIYALETTNG